MKEKIKDWFRHYPEITLFAVSLLLWLGLGLGLSALTNDWSFLYLPTGEERPCSDWGMVGAQPTFRHTL